MYLNCLFPLANVQRLVDFTMSPPKTPNPPKPQFPAEEALGTAGAGTKAAGPAGWGTKRPKGFTPPAKTRPKKRAEKSCP